MRRPLDKGPIDSTFLFTLACRYLMRSTPTRLLLILLAVALATLIPLASAAPTDPLWIPGFYDDADQDDVVGILANDGLALLSVNQTGAHVVPPDAGTPNPLAESVGITSPRSTPRLRSPPLADSNAP